MRQTAAQDEKASASWAKVTYKQNDRHVQHKGDKRIGNQGANAKVKDVGHVQTGHLDEEGKRAVGDGARGRVVVEGHDGVHLVIRVAQDALHHDQAERLEDDASNLDYTMQVRMGVNSGTGGGPSLTNEADEIELELSKGSDDDTNDDEQNVTEDLEIGRRHSERPGDEKGDDRVGGLEHLDEGDAQVDVGQVSANQTQAEHDTDGEDGFPEAGVSTATVRGRRRAEARRRIRTCKACGPCPP